MPIYKLLQGSAFEHEQCTAMGIVYEKLLKELGLVNRSDPLCEIIAHKVIELSQRGERDPDRLYEVALAALQV